MATRANHRAVAAAILLTAMAVGAIAAHPAAAGADTGSADGRRRISRGPASSPVPLLPVAVGSRALQCTKYHVVKVGETCASVARAAGITVAQFVTLNPQMPCAKLPNAPGHWVCVRARFLHLG